MLFSPKLFELREPDVQTMVCDAISKCDEVIRTELYSSIILSGGSTLFKGFPERLSKEIA